MTDLIPMQIRTATDLLTIDNPQTMRIVLSPQDRRTVPTAAIHLLRLQDTPGAKGLDGSDRIDARAHVLTLWTGPANIALDLCSRLAFALAHPVPFVFDVAELEAMCIACLSRINRDPDEDLRTGRDAASTEDTAP